jgi:leader peptidase (prepilin peptidase)/N-methyltransferase
VALFSDPSMAAPISAAFLAPFGLVLGAVIGSFLAAALIRWPQGRSVVQGRSSCDACGAPLSARDLVPLLSWALARGRCRHCGVRIDLRHPAVEAAGALIGLVSFLAHPLPAALATAAFGWWLLIVAALDAEHHWLPDRLTLPLGLNGLLVAWVGISPPLMDRLIGAAVGFAILALIALGYRALRGKEGLGGGDPKLFAALGAWLGWQPLPFVMLGAGLLGLTAVALKRARGERVGAADRLPLGTLLALAAWPIWLLLGRWPG